MGRVRITEITARSILTAQSGRDAIGYDYTINPYAGCAFGCEYCYVTKLLFGENAEERAATWGDWVEVKKNAVALLREKTHLVAGRKIFFSSATDPYQPIERRLGLTRALLEALFYAYPSLLTIQTRSPLVARDIDLLRQFGDSVEVGMSITTEDEAIRKIFEPSAPSIPRRLEAIRQVKEAGIRTHATIAPLLPCDPQRFASMLRPCVDGYWLDKLNLYDKKAKLLALYRQHGLKRFLGDRHYGVVQEALKEAFGQ
ncbi:MAG: radical SAM protein [Armatimonadetes bacterium]|nr:radical SAM protein [Armatimonadota bacterium]